MSKINLQAMTATIKRHGMILQQDKSRLNIVSLVTGETLTSSWWGHPKANTIFSLLESLSDHPDLMQCKLISGKVTFVHRRLWSALFSIGTCREPWQIENLTSDELVLLHLLDQQSEIENPGKSVKNLEKRLLVQAEQIHSAEGKHILIASSWRHWNTTHKLQALAIDEAKSLIESSLMLLAGKKQDLPWH